MSYSNNPPAPQEQGGAKTGFLAYFSGAGAAAFAYAIKTTSIGLNNLVGWTAVASHTLGQTVGSTDAAVLMVGKSGTSNAVSAGQVAPLIVDPATGSLLTTIASPVASGLYTRPGRFDTWTVPGFTSANGALLLTKAGASNQQHYVTSFIVATAGATTSADVIVELRDGSTARVYDVIGANSPRGARVGIPFSSPALSMTVGGAVNLVANAGGDSVILYAAMTGYTLNLA